MKGIAAIGLLIATCSLAAAAEENRLEGYKPRGAFQDVIEAIDSQTARKTRVAGDSQKSDSEPRKSPAAEALKDLTGMTPEQYAALEAAHRCFDVVMPPRGGQSSVITPQDSILLNRCTGETWVLVKTSTGKQGNWTYRWFSIRSIPDEVVFGP
jgi:hypothetical protein